MATLDFKMDPGKMDRVIVIEEETITHDSMGGVSKVWAELIKCWSYVQWETTGEKEGVEQGRETSESNVNFTIRDAGVHITPAMRIKYNGDLYNIISVAESGRNRYIKIYGKYVEVQEWGEV